MLLEVLPHTGFVAKSSWRLECVKSNWFNKCYIKSICNIVFTLNDALQQVIIEKLIKRSSHSSSHGGVTKRLTEGRLRQVSGNSWVLVIVQGLDHVLHYLRCTIAPSAAFKFDVNSCRQSEGEKMSDMGALRWVKVKVGCNIMDDL